MFSIRRPSSEQIEQFIDQSKALTLSYDQIGIAKGSPQGFKADEANALLGTGRDVFARARDALMNWQHFKLGWVELFPRDAAIEPDTTVAVLVHHLACWSLNGCRVVYSIDGPTRFGFAYGTLTNHAECGEEIFEVSRNDEGDVIYRIRAVSKPRAAFARIGYPITRMYQARFRRDSIQAMQRAVR